MTSYAGGRARWIGTRRVTSAATRNLSGAPGESLVRVHAVTEAGQLVITSASGSQIGPIASGAGKLVLVIGSQKVVPDLDSAFRRIQEHVFPWEDARLREAMNIGTAIPRTPIPCRG